MDNTIEHLLGKYNIKLVFYISIENTIYISLDIAVDNNSKSMNTIARLFSVMELQGGIDNINRQLIAIRNNTINYYDGDVQLLSKNDLDFVAIDASSWGHGKIKFPIKIYELLEILTYYRDVLVIFSNKKQFLWNDIPTNTEEFTEKYGNKIVIYDPSNKKIELKIKNYETT